MKDETKFGGGNGAPQGSLNCADFDRLLADALDGVMAGAELAEFKSHATACGDCGPLFSQAEAGMNWMKSLAEVEPPARLVHNILARTSMAETPVAQRVPGALVQDSWLTRALGWISPAIRPAVAAMRQPRFAMTAAMTFFSASMLLNLGGVKLKDLKYVDLRPSAITTTASVQYHETTARVVKYYENIRLVYELESRMKALKDASAESEQENPNNAPSQQQKKRDDGSSQDRKQNKNEQEDQKEQRQYVSERRQVIMAMLRIGDGFAAPVKTKNDSRSFS
jgi:hypothetical protein